MGDHQLAARAIRGIVALLPDPYASVIDAAGERRRAATAGEARAVGSAVLLGERVGYIALSGMSDSAAAELRDAIAGLVSRGMRRLILDLRGNPGGSVAAAARVADLFLDRDQPIGALRGRAPGQSQRFVAAGAQEWPHLPLVVLINDATASAAELVAAAFQDHDRAVLLGAPTHGKGLAQTTIRLTDWLSLRLSTARWYTPSGRRIDRSDGTAPGALFFSDRGRLLAGEGRIIPDVAVAAGAPGAAPDADPQVRAAWQLLRDADAPAVLFARLGERAAAESDAARE
jgi:hypothetical protein